MVIKFFLQKLFYGLLTAVFATQPGHAESPLAFKAASPDSPYYRLAVQIAGAVKTASAGAMMITVETSDGPVQNVAEAAMRAESYVFISPPALIDQAVAGEDPFEPSEHYADIRALFPLPSLTLHFVVRADSGIKTFADLAGKDFMLGSDSFGFGVAKARDFFAAIGLAGRINLSEVEPAAALAALKESKVHGFAMAGAYPLPEVAEAAAAGAIRLLTINKTQLELAAATRLVRPAGTYAGVDDEVTTLSLPVAAYALMVMEEETAYRLTRTFWESKDALAQLSAWWNGVSPDLLSTLGTVLHDGALRYYKENGIGIPAHLQ
jgi:TRAP transporter TAXI family solute receptor